MKNIKENNLTLTITQQLCPKDKYNIKCPYKMTPEYITIHNTYNDASAISEISYMISNNNQISYHYAVDDIAIIQGLPLDRNAWHAGDGGNGTGNRKSIAIEICYSKSGGNRFIQAEKNAACLTAALLKERNWNINKVKKHQDWSGKYCPHRTLDMGWQRFLNMVQSELTKTNPETNETTIFQKEPTKTEMYRVRKSWSDTSSQIGAYTNLDNAKAACKTGYSVFDSQGNIVYTTTSVTHRYSVGQHVSFGTSYPSPTLPCGITYATSGSGHGKITAIVDGQAKYQIDYIKYCNDGDIIGIYTPQTFTTSESVSESATSDFRTKTLAVNAFYKVFAGNKWYSEVKNLEDYAGDNKNPIRAIAIKTDNGSIKYRVHIKNGGWYPYVTGYNLSDTINGYAGDCQNDIDAIEIYFITPEGYKYKKAKYRLAPIGKDYYSWQYDNETTNGQDGYAGSFGTSFGRFQLNIEE